MSDLPVVEPPFDSAGQRRATARVAGVILAAGSSTRFGGDNKLLEPVAGEPMVRRVARTLLDADLDPVVAVVGHEADAVRATLEGLDVSVVENPDHSAGLASSVRAGVEALPADVDATVFALGDMPWIAPGTVRRLAEAFRAGAGTALAAACDGERGNPVLWAAAHFDALADLAGDVGGRDLLYATEGSALVETGDPGVRRDVDRPGDLGRDAG